MNIAVAVGIDKPTHPLSKGGTEVWAANYVSEHIRRGHTIDLYAGKGSLSGMGIKNIHVLEKSLPEYFSEPFFTNPPSEFAKKKEQFMSVVYEKVLEQIRSRESEYDCIVDSIAYPAFSSHTHILKKPVIAIGHFPVDFGTSLYAETFGWAPRTHMVFPSRFQYSRANFIPPEKKHVIHHGINIQSFKNFPQAKDYMLWMSRIHHTRMDKGIEDALFVSQRLQRKILVSGIVERSSREYFTNSIKPLFSDLVIFQEQTVDSVFDKNTILGEAKVFLFPIKWEEAFGLVMLEAMACGTPVIAYARGAVPEIVKDGLTGFIVNPSQEDIRGNFIVKKPGREGLCEAVERLYAMNDQEYALMRAQCRKSVEDYFSLRRMVDDYEHLYTQIF